MLGDTGTAALVGRDGSVDWLCLPRFDSPACFAALLGTPEQRPLAARPGGRRRATTRRYVERLARAGDDPRRPTPAWSRVLDLMPIGDGRADIVRRVEGVEGTVRMRHEWVVRFDYGKVRPVGPPPRRRHRGDEVITAVAGPDMLVLRGARLPHADDGRHVDEFDVARGRGADLLDHLVPLARPGPAAAATSDARIDETIARQRGAGPPGCDYDGPLRATP